MATIKKACKGGLYPKSSSVSKRLKSGGSLGMKSVKAGIDKNPGVTRADIIAAGTKQAKKGMKIKKAQNGDSGKKTVWGSAPVMKGLDFSKKSAEKRVATAKSNYESSTNPKVEYNIAKRKTPGGIVGGQSVSVDTTGMAAGQRTFPAKVTTRSGKDMYYPINRPSAKRAVRMSQQRKGGKTMKKCAYGCK